jgi:hypothetical protein
MTIFFFLRSSQSKIRSLSKLKTVPPHGVLRFIQSRKCSVEEHSWYLRELLFVWRICPLDGLARTVGSESNLRFSSDWDLELSCTIIFNVVFRNWCVSLCVLLSPIEVCCWRRQFKMACFPRYPDSAGPCTRRDWTWDRWLWNVLVSAFLEIEVLECDSAMSPMKANCWH